MVAIPVFALLVYTLLLIAALVSTFIKRRRHAARAKSSAISHGPSINPSLVVTLVHGTFAQDAGWTLPGSVFCHELGSRLEGVLFHRFRWSGRNTVGARHRATRALGAELAALTTTHPSAAHVVIAHSHGGNVALAALNKAGATLRTGLICLATPVIVSRPRYHENTTLLFRPLRFLLPIAAWLFLSLIFQEAIPVVTGIVIIGTVVALLYGRRLLSRTSHFLDETYYDNLSSDNVVFIRAPGDEASAVIAAVQGLTWLLTTLIRLPIKLARSGDNQIEIWRKKLGMRFLWICVSLFISSFIFFILAFYIENEDIKIADVIIAMLLFTVPPFFCLGLYSGGFFGVVVGYAIYPLLIVPVLLLMILSGLAIGPEMMVASLARDVTVEPCPRGTWNVALLGDLEPLAANDLQHSVIYRSEEAIDIISEWISRYFVRTQTLQST